MSDKNCGCKSKVHTGTEENKKKNVMDQTHKKTTAYTANNSPDDFE